MFGQTAYYWQLLTKYVQVFGALFNDIYIYRYDVNGLIIGNIKVGLQYAVKEKMLTRDLSDPEIQRQTAVVLPRMSYELANMDYDGDRKLNTVGARVIKNPANLNTVQKQFNPVPYNLHFKLYVYTKNIEDGNQIIEQILPFFTPDWTANIEIIPQLNLEVKVPIILNNVIKEDRWSDDFKERNMLVWELDFTMKAYLYGPDYIKPIIKFANTRMWASTTQYGSNVFTTNTGTSNAFLATNTTPNTTINALASYQILNPGLDANGNPTSNASITIPIGSIPIDSNWGIIETDVTVIP